MEIRINATTAVGVTLRNTTLRRCASGDVEERDGTGFVLRQSAEGRFRLGVGAPRLFLEALDVARKLEACGLDVEMCLGFTLKDLPEDDDSPSTQAAREVLEMIETGEELAQAIAVSACA